MSMLMRRAFMGNLSFFPVYATWNPSDKGAKVILSNGNLTASASGVGTVRSTIGKSSGKWYWEDKCDTSFCYSGAATPYKGLSTGLGLDSGSWSYQASTGQCLFASTTKATYATATTNDRIGFALDMDAGTLSIYKNGTLLGTPFTGITGTVHAATSPGTSNSKVTTIFGASAFPYGVPSGFNAGLYT